MSFLRSHLRQALTELRWFLVSMAGLAATLALEHFVVRKRILLPALEITAEPPLWMWGALFVPELVAFFAAGWRLRSWSQVILYAAGGAFVREGFELALRRAGEPGHANAFQDPFSDFAVSGAAIAVAYVLVLGLAVRSARDERRLAVDV